MTKQYRFFLQRPLSGTLTLLAAIAVLSFLVTALARMDYTYELDWMEGSFVDHVKQILSGQQLYVEPSIDFTPYFYTPLFFYLSALVSKVTGVDFFALRLVSFVASLGCFSVIFLFVRRETASNFYGLIAVGLFAATYSINGSWFDLARLDMLFLLFILLGLYFIRSAPSYKSLILASVFMFLAFLTKQSGLFIAGFFGIYSMLANKGTMRFVFPATFAVLTGASILWLNWLSEGWFYYYIFELPRQHRLVYSMILGFWSDDLMPSLAIALLVAIAFTLYNWVRLREERLFFVVVFTAMVGSSWLGRLHSGSWINVNLPTYATIAMFFALGLWHFLKNDNHKYKWMPSLVLVLCICQFLLLTYDPRKFIPTANDHRAGQHFIDLMKNVEGEIFVSYPGYLPSIAQKPYCSDGGAMGDIFRAQDEALKRKLETELRTAIENRRFGAIIVSRPWFGFFVNSPDFIKIVEENYELMKSPIFDNDAVFLPVNGGKVRPEKLYVRRKAL